MNVGLVRYRTPDALLLRAMTRRFPHLLLAVLLGAAGVAAHGGQYRGPRRPLPARVPLVPLPGGGGPTTPRTPSTAPTTGARDLQPDARTWQTWWEFNKQPYLRSRVRGERKPLTGSDDFYLGQRQPRAIVDVLAVTADDRSNRIVPALHRLIEAERNRDVQSACLIALGKLGVDGPGIDLDAVISSRIRRGDQEVRESAVLALGIAGRRRSFDVLSSLLRDDRAGRRLADRSRVRKRTRAFAAYGLGLLARRIGDPGLSQQVRDLLWTTLQDKEPKDRDLRTAIVNALGVLRRDPTRSADKRLAWQTVDQMLSWFAEDRGATDEHVTAHAAVAIGRLLGRGSSRVHQQCKERFAELLASRNNRRGAPILQSCAIGLGMLAEPAEQSPDDEAFSEVLRAYWRKGSDQTTRQLAVMALGRIGGRQNRDWLLRAYARANKGSERPWLALSLGILSAPAAAAGRADTAVGELLLRDLVAAQTGDLRAALAVGVGLSGYRDAVPRMLALLRENEGNPRTAGYLCIGLGLLRDRLATPTLTEIMQRSRRRPFLLQQCAVALGCLGDRNANDLLLEMFGDSDSLAVLSAIASAIGRIGDRRAIDKLVVLSADRELTKLARAFVAAALGGVGDKDPLPWNVPLSIDCNYATGIDTLTNGATGVLDIL